VSFSSLLWSLLLGYLIWDSWPSWNLWLGAALVLGAASLSLLGGRATRATSD
jgi:drug/metabolite transporter (DMT)-like permease